ncbi:MAG: phosphotransferase [Nocardioides sp.]
MDGFGLQPLEGGFSGETFLGEAAGERTVVRLYVGRGERRGPAAPEVDAGVLRLVRGLVPVPEVLEIRRLDPAAGTPGLLVTTFEPGERLDVVLPDLGADQRARLGRDLGTIVARLGQMPMPRAGMFVDGNLTIEPFPDATDLVAWVDHHRESSALADWSTDLADGLRGVADEAQELLAEVDRCCLVHSDLNPKNVLVDPAAGVVTALLDWEFAHAGHPATDLGNLLRFDREREFAEGVLDGYLGSAGHLDGNGRPGGRRRLLDRARAGDLWALVDLAGRRGTNPVADRADERLRVIAATGDLHAGG